jgi:hypothetical protein
LHDFTLQRLSLDRESVPTADRPNCRRDEAVSAPSRHPVPNLQHVVDFTAIALPPDMAGRQTQLEATDRSAATLLNVTTRQKDFARF